LTIDPKLSSFTLDLSAALKLVSLLPREIVDWLAENWELKPMLLQDIEFILDPNIILSFELPAMLNFRPSLVTEFLFLTITLDFGQICGL
jgi:hypothetical protein